MKTITVNEYIELKKTKRNKIGVADKLQSFLNSNIVSLKKDCAYVIEAKEFLGTDAEDFHYYTALKMLQANFSEKLDWSFDIAKNGRSDKIRIKIK